MDFLDPAIEHYALQHSQPESNILQKINRQTHAQVLMPRMLSGALQGNVLATFSRMIKPMNVLEIGTYTGYSAICLAQGVQAQGKVYTIDINEELEARVRAYFEEAQMTTKINYYIGNALHIIPTLDVLFDIVFIDADKKNYAAYYDLVFDKVNKGGYIIADNVLWSGKVLHSPMDEDTASIDAFNKKVHNDKRVRNLLMPIRDGLMIAQKI